MEYVFVSSIRRRKTERPLKEEERGRVRKRWRFARKARRRSMWIWSRSWHITRLWVGLQVAKPLPTCWSPVGWTPKKGAFIFTYLLCSIVNLSVFTVSGILLPDAPCQKDPSLEVSPFADRTTINLNVTSEYRSLSSSIILKLTPDSVILSPIRWPGGFSKSFTPLLVTIKLLDTTNIVLCLYSVPSVTRLTNSTFGFYRFCYACYTTGKGSHRASYRPCSLLFFLSWTIFWRVLL